MSNVVLSILETLEKQVDIPYIFPLHSDPHNEDSAFDKEVWSSSSGYYKTPGGVNPVIGLSFSVDSNNHPLASPFYSIWTIAIANLHYSKIPTVFHPWYNIVATLRKGTKREANFIFLLFVVYYSEYYFIVLMPTDMLNNKLFMLDSCKCSNSAL